jgi:hypothetical protein
LEEFNKSFYYHIVRICGIIIAHSVLSNKVVVRNNLRVNYQLFDNNFKRLQRSQHDAKRTF